jgi:hypothetical protein
MWELTTEEGLAIFVFAVGGTKSTFVCTTHYVKLLLMHTPFLV